MSTDPTLKELSQGKLTSHRLLPSIHHSTGNIPRTNAPAESPPFAGSIRFAGQAPKVDGGNSEQEASAVRVRRYNSAVRGVVPASKLTRLKSARRNSATL